MKTYIQALAALLTGFICHSEFSFAQNYKAGTNAGNSLTTGYSNAFVGTSAGSNTTSGHDNSFFGFWSGPLNTTGNHNSFFGSNTGRWNTGSGNSFFGSFAGENNYSAGSNSFFGNRAGNKNSIGSSNSFFGAYAGYANATGSANNFFGVNAGYANTSGSNNIFVGNFAGYNSTTGQSNVFIGVVSALKNTTGSRNTYVGEGTGGAIDTGSDHVFIGHRAANKWTGNSNGNTVLGSNATAMGSNSTAIGFRAHVSTSNSLVLGSVSGVNGAVASTSVGIGTTAPSYILHVNGDAAKPGSSAWIVASDQRLKENISTFTEGLSILEQIKPVKYRYNGKAGMPTGKEYIGVIAQQVQKVAPYMVGTFTYQDTLGHTEQYLDYDATALTYLLVNAAKELKAENDLLKQENTALQTQLTSLEAKVAHIERMLKLSAEEQARINYEGALFQNTPNPFSVSTTIRYSVPAGAVSAFVKLYTINGQELQHFDITGNSQGELTISAQALSAGTYLCRLFVNGQGVDSKKIVVTR